ncbi:MAG: signal peptidase I, partial [Planctomycetota bacterium]
FAVAIALALIVRHYSLEAFRIPSKSMMPTLLGSETGGDRILVDKGRWLRHEPARWEPTVFQYPLNRSKNFIKRMVGMPGETLKIQDGDIWTSRGGAEFTIERKPEGPQEALFFPYYPEPIEERGFFANRPDWEGLGWEIDEPNGRFSVDASGKVTLRFLADVLRYNSEGIWDGHARLPESGEGHATAGDLRVRFDLRVDRAGTLAVELTEHGLARRLVLAPGGSHATVAHADGTEERFPIDVRLGEGDYALSFANVDDALVVAIEGDADFRTAFPFSSKGDAEEGAGEVRSHRVAFEADGLKATLNDIRIDRDVHYTHDHGQHDPRLAEGLEIPEDHYFMLGDNTQSSKDSRAWQIAEVTMKDGTVIRWEEGRDLHAGDVPGQPDANFDIEGPDRVIEVKADVDGLVRRFHTSEVDHKETNVPYGLVSKDHLVGRAFAIFWPIHVWPVVKQGTRIGLIR